ncbi:hypothetical protein [Aquimarina sp. MMG016]|uniref:hypothetical protein n=1 Tax=Aquimarina sp. MMG016 TaxID=2822690 RepID=UPI001B3A0E2C|nr:hypothetical protein [Aquimarina sp. MMG016]MBQ4821049.1 hypothetical protein [Aquimarina sp. MMG016]
MFKILLFFQRFSVWFKVLLRELFNNVISLFFILALYLSLWHFPQTIDLLLILNQADAFLLEVPLYFSLLVASAFLIWNIPKYFYYHNYKDITLSNFIGFEPNQHYKFQKKKEDVAYVYLAQIHMRKTVPRMLATLILMISALGILNAMELFELSNIYTDWLDPDNTLIACIIFLLLLCEPKLYGTLQLVFYRTPKIRALVLLVSIGLIIFIISLGTLNTQTEKDLGNLFLANCALGLLFLTLAFNSYSFLKKVSRKWFYGTILISGFTILVSFLILNLAPKLSSKINPLSILVLSLLSLFMISFILILLGKKIKLPLFSIFFIIGFFSTRFFSVNSEHYHLDLKNTEVSRLTMDSYLYNWIKNRESLIENRQSTFPVILVSAEGGGSRAGLWSFLVHSYLYEKSEGRYFEENLLSLTGASGGSVGNAMFFAEVQDAFIKSRKTDFKLGSYSKFQGLKYKASAIYKENYLSEAILSLLGRDLFKDITNLFDFKNRGQLLEEQWSSAHKRYFSKREEENLLGREFLSFYKNVSNMPSITDDSFVPPLLLINTTHTQTGHYNIISPVSYANVSELDGIDDFLGGLRSRHPDKSIALSTAMRINASFPYITPVGEIKNIDNSGEIRSDQYADAGYYDNIGGRVSKGVEEEFLRVLKKHFPSLVDKVTIRHLIIANAKEQEISKTQTQLAAPLATLQNVRYGHTQEIVEKLGEQYAVKLKPTAINPPSSSLSSKKSDKELLIKPILPLGRYLSTVAIMSTEARLEEISVKLDLILK